MIQDKFQGNSNGKKAMHKLIEMISEHDDFDRVRLSVVPENEGAITFYKNVGFVLTDEFLEGERAMEWFC